MPALGGWPAYGTWAVAGLGMGLGMPSVGVLLFEHSPEHRRGADSAALQIADVTASALSVGLIGVLAVLALVGLPVAGRAAAPAERGIPVAATTLAP